MVQWKMHCSMFVELPSIATSDATWTKSQVQNKILGDSCLNSPECTGCVGSITDLTKVTIYSFAQSSCSCAMNICEGNMHLLSVAKAP